MISRRANKRRIILLAITFSVAGVCFWSMIRSTGIKGLTRRAITDLCAKEIPDLNTFAEEMARMGHSYMNWSPKEFARRAVDDAVPYDSKRHTQIHFYNGHSAVDAARCLMLTVTEQKSIFPYGQFDYFYYTLVLSSDGRIVGWIDEN